MSLVSRKRKGKGAAMEQLGDLQKRYLKLLSEKYPTIASAHGDYQLICHYEPSEGHRACIE